MARTQAADYDFKRGEIVERAAELFAERGFLGASIADLGAACGLSKSALYHYYPSKDDILFDVMGSHVEKLVHIAADVGAQRLAPAAALEALTQRLMEAYVGAAARHRVLLNELSHLPPAQQQHIVTLQRRLIDFVETLLTQLSPALARSAKKRRPAAMLYFGMLNWTHTWYSAEGPLPARELAQTVVELTLGGVHAIS